MNETDRAIWERVLAGHSRAFGGIWDRHRDRVFGHLLVLGNARTDAEDLTAVAFMELWRKRTAVRFVDDSLLPWLLVTALNVSRNAARSRRRYRAMLGKLPIPEPVPDHADAERENPRVRHAREVLAAAKPADRELVVLTAVEGFTVREAALALGIGESAAKMRLSRLRARLTAPESVTEGALS